MLWVIKCLLYKCKDLNSDPSTTIQANKPVGYVCVCVVVMLCMCVYWCVVVVVCVCWCVFSGGVFVILAQGWGEGQRQVGSQSLLASPSR